MWQRSKSKRPTTTRSSTCTAKCRTSRKNNFKTGRTQLTSNEVSDMKVRVYGNTAVITGKADVAGTMAGKDTRG
jgi:hypothetical protein